MDEALRGRGRKAAQRLGSASPDRYVVYIAFLLIFGFFALTLQDDGFLTQTNLLNVVRQTMPVTVMAVATVFVLSAGVIDLSLGAVVALSALATADVMQTYSPVLAVATGLAVGLGVGAVNGIFVTLLRLPSFLVTLATFGVVAGLARSITDLQSIAVDNQTFVDVFGTGDVGPVPSLALWGLGAVALGQFVFRHRRFGAHVVATGDNTGAARVAGIRVDRTRFAVLVLSGAAAALAGILYTGRLQGASYTLGEQDLLTVLAAVVIGGTRPLRRRRQCRRRPRRQLDHGSADERADPLGPHLVGADDGAGDHPSGGHLAHAP